MRSKVCFNKLYDERKKGLSHDQIENLVVRQLFFRKKRKKLGCGRVFLNYDVL